jgi:hypothetical protein
MSSSFPDASSRQTLPLPPQPIGPDPATRKRKSYALPISTRRAIYDWTAIVLLLAPSAVGIFLFGAVRLWSVGPLMFCSYLGVAMFFLRPFFASDLRTLKVPPGGIL